MKAQRYRTTACDDEFIEDSKGEWMLSDDGDKLEAEVEALRQKVKDMCEVAVKLLDPLEGWNDQLRRGATSIPQKYENQVATASQVLKRIADREVSE